MEIKVPSVIQTDYSKQNFAIEVAFNTLLAEAKNQGLSINPVMGLMYLPTQELTRLFQQSCRDILAALSVQEGRK